MTRSIEAPNACRSSRADRVLAAAALLLAAGAASAADIKVGGYAKLDVLVSDRIAGGGGNRVAEVAGGASAVPLSTDRDARHGDSTVNARESRLNVTATGEAEAVKLKGFIEADFMTSEGSTFVSNSRGLRLRHAYGQATFANGFFVLGGQYWSNFQNNEQFYGTIDFNGPAGQLFNRSPQLRVGWKGAGLAATLSAEQTAVAAPDDSIEPIVAQSQDLPVFTGKVHYAWKGLTAQGALAYGQNRATVGRSSAWGAQLGVEVPVPGPVAVTLQAHVDHLDGVNRLANGDFADAALVAGDVKNVVTTGFYAGLSAAVTKTTTLSAYYGQRKAEEAVVSAGEDELQETVHASVVQKLWGGLEAGVEYQHARRQRFDGERGEMNRVQGAMWLYF
jgi:hypothetical protein